jgi:recombination associated protein RdgC
MILKNATLYKLEGELPALADLELALTARQLLPLAATQQGNCGFVQPRGGAYVEWFGDYRLFTFAQQERRIPGETLRAELKKAADALQKQQGFAPGRKQLRDLKDRVITELLPRAFPKTKRFNVLYDVKAGVLAVDTANGSKGDDAMSWLRNTLGELPAVPMFDAAKVQTFLKACVVAQEASGSALELVQEVEVYTDGEARVRYDGTGLAEAAKRVDGGMRVRKLAFQHGLGGTFTLDEAGILSKLRLSERVETDEKQDADEAFQSEFAAFGLTLSTIVSCLSSTIQKEIHS